MTNRFPKNTNTGYLPDASLQSNVQDVGSNVSQQQQQYTTSPAFRQHPQIITSPSPSYAQGQNIMGKFQQSSISSQLSPLSSMIPASSISPRKSMAGLISPIAGSPNVPFQPSSSNVYQQQSPQLQAPISPMYRAAAPTFPTQQQYPPTISPHQQSHLLMVQQSSQRMQYPRSPHGHPQLSPTPHPAYLPEQVHFKAARQLNLQLPTDGNRQSVPIVRPVMYTTTQSSIPSVQPTLPVLSFDDLDILSDLPVTPPTVKKPSPVAHIERSPLLQKHLLMPVQPISGSQSSQSPSKGPATLVKITSPSLVQDSLLPHVTTFENTKIKKMEQQSIEKAPQSENSQIIYESSVPEDVEMVDAPETSEAAENTDSSLNEEVKTEAEIQRSKLSEHHRLQLEEYEEEFKIILQELFFLQNGGNIMEFMQFCKKPSNKLLEFLKKSSLEKRTRKESQESSTASGREYVDSPMSDSSGKSSKKSPAARHREKMMSSDTDTGVQMSEEPATTSKSEAPPIVKELPSIITTTPATNKLEVTTPIQLPLMQKLKRINPRLSVSTAYDESIGSQEEILERAKQEAVIQRKVVELRKQGLWSQKRLPKVQEPPRAKTHWDYLLEEMRWLSADFAQERKWKRAAARKLVRTVANYHKDQEEKSKKAEKDEQMKLRKIASTMAREIKHFWKNIEKVVDYKQQSLLGEKRQKALDIHLNFIVDQTEKYSDWLTQGLNKPMSVGSASPLPSSRGSKQGSDDEFLPQGSASDDEETIAFAEQDIDKDTTDNELTLLEQESKLPFDELLSNLPPEVIENIGKPLEEDKVKVEALEDTPKVKEELPTTTTADDTEDKLKSDEKHEESSGEDDSSKPTPISLRRSARKRKSTTDEAAEEEAPKKKTKKEEGTTSEAETTEQVGSDFEGDVSSEDDEATVAVEEAFEDHDHDKEIEELEADNDMSIEELMKKYAEPPPDSTEMDEDQPSTSEQVVDEPEEDVDIRDEDYSDEEASDVSGNESEEEIGMDYLLNKDLTKDDQPAIIPPSTEEASKTSGSGSPNKEITDVAAEAASLQPTGTTLATTQVVTPIPILLRHTLREYQHIGLDWLVTMYDKRLNGILADEMGLGKTIQTIALLAHLACEKSIWGPHLIVVPTSVMLNWEMEFKKWCPGFKILTYYGNQKERKLKRTGWTKSNAFHVCITSYKLVLQDHSSFRRKKWKYLVLDEAQNIKNFKSQRWQSLLNFNSQRRLLLTGTPLQNNLMELWSLMHFLMPHVFQSHKEFKEWFSNPLTGMIEGSQEYSESIVRRLHKVLRPFLLRRIKKDVEKQMPNKYEHVVMCHLSKRQRFLYEDFMSRAATKDSLASGHFMSVINILMQLRKVCNHPNLFEPRPIVSPFIANCIQHYTASLITKALDKPPLEVVNLPHIPSLCKYSRVHLSRTSQLQTPRKLIEEIDSSTPVSKRPSKPRYGVRDKLLQLILQEKQSALSKQGQIPPPLNLTIQNSNHLPKDSKAQSITLQYQTNEGTKWTTLANKQIRHLPGGVVQIVTSTTKENVPIKVQRETKPEVVEEPEIFPELPQLVNISDIPVANHKEYAKLVKDRQAAERFATLQRIARLNEERCNESNAWLAADTIQLLSNITKDNLLINLSSNFFPDKNTKRSSPRMKSAFITEVIKSPLQRLKEMQPVTSRYVLFIPKVIARPIDFHVSHPTPDSVNKKQLLAAKIEECYSRLTAPMHSIQSSMAVQFPEARLIQYDCGKLQVLNVLLRRFWKEKHRCLVFTQMTKVLDILEAFLSYHGYRYLRLDGSTKVEERMSLMERFNNDPRIFIFILSTRSGGVGVNLTGADTVIFYDSDWNPTMDAQAQDRCHRIGQTRDVHIYRLISERTVEENILKKANQKRLLGEMAIEGGSFTTAFFKEQALKDLFKEPTGIQELPPTDSKTTSEPPPLLSKPITARQKAIAAAKDKEAGKETEDAPKVEKTSEIKEEKDFEKALLESEDKEDAIAAKQAKEEQDADMEEFDEARDGEGQSSRLQDELQGIYEELTPIERYALRYLEEYTEEVNDEELKMAEDQVHEAKKEWELTHLVALKEEEEKKLLEDDEIFYTREDSCNEVWIDDVTGEVMPIWFPPTPPEDTNDVYIDVISNLLYSSVPMPDVELPALHTKKDRKRTKTGDGTGPKKKISRDFHIPSSLFNNRTTHSKKKDKAKIHGNKKQQQEAAAAATAPAQAAVQNAKESTVANATSTAPTDAAPAVTVPAPLPVVPTKETVPSADVGDWLVTEDWALLQAVQQVLELPLSLVVIMPAHTPNWDLVADIVNAVSAVFRSAKMCKQRFEQVIAPREDGRNIIELPITTTPTKKKSAKALAKLKSTKTHKTSTMLSSDNNQQLSRLHSNRFSTVKNICTKRAPPSKSSTVSQFQRNPKHTTILMDNNINYDNPLPPTEVALMRANRIAREKKLAADQAKQTTTQQSTSSSAHVQISTSQLPKNITQGSQQLTAIPLSTSNIIVNSTALTAALKNQNLQRQINNANKTKINAVSLQQSLLRTPNQQQIQITQGSTVSLPAGTSLHRLATSGSGITVATTDTIPTSRPPTITLASQVKLTPQQIQVVTKQRLKPGKQITPQRVQLTPQQMKQLRLVQQQQQQLVVSGSQTKGPAGTRQFQARPGTTTLSAQDLTLLMNKNFGKTIPRGSKVHIAPVLAHEQAQQVQAVAAQQAAQSTNTSKPLPITVPVSNIAVNIGQNMSIANTSVSTSKLSTMNIPQSYIIQQQQQQLVKQRPNQQQPRQVQVNLTATGSKKAVYAMMNKRKLTATLVPQSATAPSQQPVAVTVTKLLQPQTTQQKLQQLQGAQIRMSQPQVATTISSTVSNQGRLINPPQRQATMNMQQFKQLVSSQQAQLVTLAAPPSSIMTSTTKLSPSVQHQILVQSQIQLRKQPTVSNPQILTQVQQSASSLAQPGVSVIGPTVTINPTSSTINPSSNEVPMKPNQATVQVSVLPEGSLKQNIATLPTTSTE